MTSGKTDSDKPITSTMEDYLEAIYDLDQEKRVVRVRDIAKRLGVRMPTVTSMLKNLGSRGLVHYEKHEYVELTEDGEAVGSEMRRRHEVLRRFLTEVLQAPPDRANAEACLVEHALSEETLESLTDFMEFIQVCPRAGDNWLEHFSVFREQGRSPGRCREHAPDFVDKYEACLGTGACTACNGKEGPSGRE
ncbi:MAG: metal-dependent transcriptional regulator [Desulfatibacillaceae bacterium]